MLFRRGEQYARSRKRHDCRTRRYRFARTADAVEKTGADHDRKEQHEWYERYEKCGRLHGIRMSVLHRRVVYHGLPKLPSAFSKPHESTHCGQPCLHPISAV